MRAMSLVLVLALAGFPAGAETLVEKRAIEDRKAVYATVESSHVSPGRVRIAGTLHNVTVVEGAKVQAGERIAEVRDPRLGLQLAALEARIGAIRSQRDLAENELRRARELRRAGTIAEQRLDEAETRVKIVAAELNAATAERAVIAESINEGAVLAPVAGRVLKVRLRAGTNVQPGETVADIAAETYVLRLRLPERHARFLKAGDSVGIGRRGLGGTEEATASGRIRLVYPELDRGLVVADIELADLGDYFVGERVRVDVAVGTREAIIVPPDLVFVRFGATFARLVDGREVPVRTGGAIAGGIEILTGLMPGDRLAPP
ncbi:MAG: efflux RND transporter periplasmic adaptor subunit [Alphaproteobacteria bacterium]|nr:efflux RND transporter periplasmic adaptor subunit [Alphaproteobacteria bacterium]